MAKSGGDPLQGIFGFAGPLVNLNDTVQMGRFSTVHNLTTPHRWIIGGNEQLGNDLLKIREKLLSELEIDLSDYLSIEFKEGIYTNHYHYVMDVLKTTDSVLVIDSNSITTTSRENFIVAFKYIPLLIEAFDGKDFYASAIHFDNKQNLPSIEVLHKFIKSKFSNLDKWYDKNNMRFKTKRDPLEERALTKVKELVSKLSSDYSLLDMKELIIEIKNLKGVNCARRDLLNSLSHSMEDAHYSGISVLEAMRNHRNGIRRVGRKIYGKCVGTTLLTKGLEFDTVIVLGADKFKDPQNFYVAISRCVKRLIIFSESSKLKPYSQ